MLGAFYNRPIELGDSDEVSVEHLLELASEIMKIAEYLDCVSLSPWSPTSNRNY